MEKKMSRIPASFTDRVLAVVTAIPRGETRTYGEVARLAGNPKAARAVGTIMRNNYRPDIPCHRVVRSDDTLGQYNRGGTEKKRILLQEEGVWNGNGEGKNLDRAVVLDKTRMGC